MLVIIKYTVVVSVNSVFKLSTLDHLTGFIKHIVIGREEIIGLINSVNACCDKTFGICIIVIVTDFEKAFIILFVVTVEIKLAVCFVGIYTVFDYYAEINLAVCIKIVHIGREKIVCLRNIVELILYYLTFSIDIVVIFTDFNKTYTAFAVN